MEDKKLQTKSFRRNRVNRGVYKHIVYLIFFLIINLILSGFVLALQVLFSRVWTLSEGLRFVSENFKIIQTVLSFGISIEILVLSFLVISALEKRKKLSRFKEFISSMDSIVLVTIAAALVLLGNSLFVFAHNQANNDVQLYLLEYYFIRFSVILNNPIFFIYVLNYFLLLFLTCFLALRLFFENSRIITASSCAVSVSTLSVVTLTFSIYDIYNTPLLILSFVLIPGIITLIFLSRDVARFRYAIKDFEVKGGIVLFKGKSHKKLLAILEITNITRPEYIREDRETPRVVDHLLDVGKTSYFSHHLPILAKQIPHLAYEIVVRGSEIKLYFYLTIDGTESLKVLQDDLTNKINFLTVTLETAFPGIKLELLKGGKLKECWMGILNYGDHKVKKINPDIIEIDRGMDRFYVSVLQMDSIPANKPSSKLTQVDQMIHNFLSNGLNCHFISVIEFKSKKDFTLQMKSRTGFTPVMSFNTGTPNSVTPDQIRRQMLEGRHRNALLSWQVSNYVVVKGFKKNIHRQNLEKVSSILKTIYSDSKQLADVRGLKNRNLLNALPNVLLRNSISPTKMTTEQLIPCFHFPAQALTFPEGKFIPKFEIPKHSNDAIDNVPIGHVLFRTQELFPTHIDLEELNHNIFVTGLADAGRIEFVANLLINLSNKFPEVAWLVLDPTGRYKDLLSGLGDSVIHIGMGDEGESLRINPFDPALANPGHHGRKVFSILMGILKKGNKMEPEIEEVLRESFIQCVKDGEKRSFQSYFKELEDRANILWRQNPSLRKSLSQIQEQLQDFVKGAVEKVVNVHKPSISLNKLMGQKILIDISSTANVQKDDRHIAFFLNLILKYVIDQALRKSVANELKHIIVIEGAQILIPTILREVSDSALGEDMLLLLNGRGVSLICGTDRPFISRDILERSAVKVSFRLRDSSDIKQITRYQRLSPEQGNYLRNLPDREAIITSVNCPPPYRVRLSGFLETPSSPRESHDLNKEHYNDALASYNRKIGISGSLRKRINESTGFLQEGDKGLKNLSHINSEIEKTEELDMKTRADEFEKEVNSILRRDKSR